MDDGANYMLNEGIHTLHKTTINCIIYNMRWMAYNIFEGAQNTFPDVLAVVDTAQPDLLVINEANGFDNDGKLDALASAGLQYYHIEKCGDGDQYHVALLSREPLHNVQAIRPLARAAILAEVRVPGVGEAGVVGTHLTPFSETKRVKEIECILAALKKYDDAAIVGDMNALSPEDTYPDNFLRALTPSQRKKFSANNRLSFSAIQTILDAGFVDIAVQTGKQDVATVPTQANTDPDHARLRLDYIFAMGKLAGLVVRYEVLVNETTNASSDHYPLVVDFDNAG